VHRQKSLPRRLVAAFTDDPEARQLHHGHARTGRAALWVRVSDDDRANRAILGLAGCATLHLRHHGHRRQSDFSFHGPPEPGAAQQLLGAPVDPAQHHGITPARQGGALTAGWPPRGWTAEARR
jgi:hypothetical protein